MDSRYSITEPYKGPKCPFIGHFDLSDIFPGNALHGAFLRLWEAQTKAFAFILGRIGRPDLEPRIVVKWQRQRPVLR